MAWARQSKKSGKWGGVYRDASGTVCYLPITQRTKTEASRLAATEEEKARRGQRHDPTGARMKWGAWCDEWLPTRGVEASTEAASRAKVKRARERWGTTPLGMISRHALQAWVRQLEREVGPSTVRQTFYLVSSSLDSAIAHGYLDVNPCAGVKLPTPPPATERYLTDAEINALFYQFDGRWRLFVETLLGTGLRIAELCGLHWERVDLDAGTVLVVETWDIMGGRQMKAYPKSRRLRAVPLSAGLVDVLATWRARNPDTGGCGRPHVADAAKATRARARGRTAPTSCRSSLVIPGPQGAPIDPKNFGQRQWTQAVELSGISHATPHSLRHTYASRLLTAGVSIARVSKLLGHASISTTERYAHLIDDGHDEVRAALEGRSDALERGAQGSQLRAV